jgi:hypothetical protein
MKRYLKIALVCAAFFAGTLASNYGQSAAAAGATTGSSTGGGNPGSPSGGGGTGGGASGGLQAESKVLTYQTMVDSIDAQIGHIPRWITNQKSVPPGVTFMFSLTFAVDDAASCWELKRQLAWMDYKLAYLKKITAIQDPVKQSLQGIETDINKWKQRWPSNSGAAPAASASSSSFPPGINELEGVGGDASQIGLVLSGISSALTIAESLHSSTSTTEGALGLDVPTLNAVVASRLEHGGYNVSDFTQDYLSESAYDFLDDYGGTKKSATKDDFTTMYQCISPKDPAITPPLDPGVKSTESWPVQEHFTVMELADVLQSCIDSLDGQFGTASSETLPSDFTSAQTYLNTILTQGAPGASGIPTDVPGQLDHLTQAQTDEINHDLGILTHSVKPEATRYQNDLKGLGAVITAAAAYEQLLEGPLAPKYPVSSTYNPIVTQQQNNSTGNSTNAAPASPSAPSSGSSYAPLTTPISLLEKFAMIERFVRKLDSRNVYLITPHVIVGDATQTTVTRPILTNFTAISSHAVVILQIFDPSTGDAVPLNPEQADRYYTYYAGRIRDISENHDKERDSMAQIPVQWGNFQIYAVSADALKAGNYDKVYPNNLIFTFKADCLVSHRIGKHYSNYKLIDLKTARLTDPNIIEEVSAPGL